MTRLKQKNKLTNMSVSSCVEDVRKNIGNSVFNYNNKGSGFESRRVLAGSLMDKAIVIVAENRMIRARCKYRILK